MRFVIIILMLFYFVNGVSQKPSTIESSYSIQWTGQFPNSQIKKNKVNWFNRILFGKKESLQIIKPNAVIKTNSNSYFILDQGNNTIFRINNNEIKVPKIIKKNSFGFTSLVNFCAINNDEILFTDSRLNKIFKYNEDKKELIVFGKNIHFNRPTGIAYSTITKEIWVVETGSHKISVLNEKGQLIKTIGKRGIAPSEFNFPTSIWIDKTGKVYIVDTLNYRIQIFDQFGKIVSVFGEPGNATGYFARSKGIATDSHGNIYVSDALFHTVQIFDVSGKYLYQFGEQGRGKGQFWMPSGIYIDDDDSIYVADSYNSRIQIFKLVKDQ